MAKRKKNTKYLRHVAELLHKEFGHELDGALCHKDRVYNSIQCLCFWGKNGTLDGHDHWAPKSPKTAVNTIVKQLEKLPSKATAVMLMNTLAEVAGRKRTDLPKANKYKVMVEKADTGHEVEKLVVVEQTVAPAIVKETKKKAATKKQLEAKAKEKADEKAEVQQ